MKGINEFEKKFPKIVILELIMECLLWRLFKNNKKFSDNNVDLVIISLFYHVNLDNNKFKKE